MISGTPDGDLPTLLTRGDQNPKLLLCMISLMRKEDAYNPFNSKFLKVKHFIFRLQQNQMTVFEGKTH